MVATVNLSIAQMQCLLTPEESAFQAYYKLAVKLLLLEQSFKFMWEKKGPPCSVPHHLYLKIAHLIWVAVPVYVA